MKVAWFATKGTGTNEAKRIQELVAGIGLAVELPFDKSAKFTSFLRLWRAIRDEHPSLLVMEGTGVAGGLACLLARLLLGIPYVVSSGDAVGPFMAGRRAWLGLPFGIYERLLCRLSAGFIGWTPYLVGRALAFGAPRAVTAEGWTIGGAANVPIATPWRDGPAALCVGLVGHLDWNPRHHWCYGMDLVRALRRTVRQDLRVIVVGDGSGLEHLRREAGEDLGRRIFLPGAVPLAAVVSVMSSFDVGSLPQSVDGVGSYRYTTKLPEYAEARLPVITNRIPAAYDLGVGWMWRLPGDAPWCEDYLAALVRLLEGMTLEDVEEKRSAIPALRGMFDRGEQVSRVREFLSDLLSELPA